jgi:hypothetical protein
MPNAASGVNTVLQDLTWEAGDVSVYFSMIYDTSEKTIASVSEAFGGVVEVCYFANMTLPIKLVE